MIINTETEKALEMQHRDELRSLTERDALIATNRLLAMAAATPYPTEKVQSRGLIMRQEILYGLRK